MGQADTRPWRSRRVPCPTARISSSSACNWLVDAGSSSLCPACTLNRTIPDLTQPENLRRWRRIEMAKHRLVYSLLRLGLPDRQQDRAARYRDRLRFPCAASRRGWARENPDGPRSWRDHAQRRGSGRRGSRRDPQNMHEPYRTLLGHFRHEIAHYYFGACRQGQAGLRPFPKDLRRRNPRLR